MKNDIGTFKVAVCAIILDKDNNTLITQRSFKREHHPGEWEVMTGRLDQGEGFIEALHREVKEELDIEVEPITPINTFHFYRGEQKVEHVGVTYICRWKGGNVKVDGFEEIAFKWVKLEEALIIVKDESIKRDFKLTLEYLNK